MSLRDNPVVEYLLMVQGGANIRRLDEIASPQLAKLLEVDTTELVLAVPPPRRPTDEQELEAPEVDTEDEGTEAGARASGPAPNIFESDDFTEDGFVPFAEAEAGVRAGPPFPGLEYESTAHLSDYARQIAEERVRRESNMIEQISTVARGYRKAELFQPWDRPGVGERDRVTLTDIFTGGHVHAMKAAVQLIRARVCGPVRKVQNAFDFILANDEDVRSLFSQLVVRQLTRTSNLNPRVVNLQAAYRWNEEHLDGILMQFNNYDFHRDHDGYAIFTPFEREDVWDTPAERDNGSSQSRRGHVRRTGPVFNS